MRLSRPIALAIAALLAAPAAGHAAPRHAGSLVYIRPAVKRTAIDFTSYARSTGSVGGAYVAQWTVDGSIVSNGIATAVDDAWTSVVATPGAVRPAHHAYPASASSDVVLVYTGWVVAPGGVPAVYCQSVLTRTSGGPASVTGTC